MRTIILAIHDQPDALVRIIQVIHRRGGHVRSLRITPGHPWATMRITVQGITNPERMIASLEKLVDVHDVQFAK